MARDVTLKPTIVKKTWLPEYIHQENWFVAERFP